MTRSSTSPAVRRSRGPRARAASYAFFLMTALLVTVIGLSALTVARIEMRGATESNQRTEAQFYAQSGVEQAALAIFNNPSWRSTITHNAWTTPQAIGNGTLSWKIVDDVNGRFDTDRNAIVRACGKGVSGGATWVYSAEIQPPPEQLMATLLTNGNLEDKSIAPWTAYGGCAIDIRDSPTHGGAASMRINGRAPGSGAKQVLPTLTNGGLYAGSVYVQADAGSETVWFGLQVTSSSGSRYIELARTTAGRNWTQLSGTIRPSWDGSFVRAELIIGSDGKEDMYVDDARFVATPGPTGIRQGTWRRESQ